MVVWVVFQFPLHRDPRCNRARFTDTGRGLFSFSSLYIGILAATHNILLFVVVNKVFQFPLHRDPRCNMCILPKREAPCWGVAGRLPQKLSLRKLYYMYVLDALFHSRFGNS